uniref:Lysosomal-trafficking regulator n=1 Tax=Parascaris univalens TaxID=6257 RepID=A0A914ZVM3_PARUN
LALLRVQRQSHSSGISSFSHIQPPMLSFSIRFMGTMIGSRTVSLFEVS